MHNKHLKTGRPQYYTVIMHRDSSVLQLAQMVRLKIQLLHY